MVTQMQTTQAGYTINCLLAYAIIIYKKNKLFALKLTSFYRITKKSGPQDNFCLLVSLFYF